MSLLILVVDDEPDVEVLFRQLFRRDLSASRFTMEFAQSAPAALQRIADATPFAILRVHALVSDRVWSFEREASLEESLSQRGERLGPFRFEIERT